MIKVGDKVMYVGDMYVRMLEQVGIVMHINSFNTATVYFPDAKDGSETGLAGVRLWNIHYYEEEKYLLINVRDLSKINGGDNMRKVLVVGNTGNYQTQANKGDIVDVLYECFGYVMTSRGKVKDIDYVEYKEGEMIAHINDLRDCFKAGLRFTDENNLVYPDGKIALKAENLQYLDRTFKVKRFKKNQFVIGNEKVELCFGYSEIGTIVEFRR